jgi:hypothetical protein
VKDAAADLSGTVTHGVFLRVESTDISARGTREGRFVAGSGVSVPEPSVETPRDQFSRVNLPDLSARPTDERVGGGKGAAADLSGTVTHDAFLRVETTDRSARGTREVVVEPASGVTVPDLSVETSRARGSRVDLSDLSAPGVTDPHRSPGLGDIPHLE